MLVDFYADWCGPCQTQTPILESLAAANADQVTVVKVDVDQDAALAQRFGIRSIPTLVLFNKGAEISRQVGALPANQLQDWLDSASPPRSR